jgi:hypothetical protein
MNRLINCLCTTVFALALATACQPKQPDSLTLTKEELQNKIKGAWAAQTIGVTFGTPIEFEYNGTMVQDYQKIEWYDGYLKDTYDTSPGSYDDIYMDLTFVQVFEDEGLDAPVESFAKAYAYQDYFLWFANQQSRYNVQNGIMPPESGHWLNNPCADDIDFQIEADFAGIMTPGMINAGVEVCDKIGHIMNYGDGYYGGVYVSAMYSLAYISDDIEYIVEEALKVIPKESNFYKTIADVIKWHKQDPVDWKGTWFKTNRKWSQDIGSPFGVFQPFNIDAKINAAWVVMGLLYGDGDFTRTYEIATRCGDDADCNPATAGGILGAVKGYDDIPDYWKMGLSDVEPIDFKYTTISLNDVYDMSFKHALQMIERNGGEVGSDHVTIKVQQPETIPLEVAFEGHYPNSKIMLDKEVKDELSFEFEGIGFALAGGASKTGEEDYVFEVEMYVDGNLVETAKLPTAFRDRRFYPFYKYQLPKGLHKVMFKVLNPTEDAKLQLQFAVTYDDEPFSVQF